MATWLAALVLILIQLQADKPASIEGVVVKAATGEPIALAGVEAARSEDRIGRSFTAATDSEGKFALRDLPPGKYRLAATHAGFVRSEYHQRSVDGFPGLGAVITLSSGQAFKNAAISLVDTGALYGHVTNSAGTPIPNMRVSALKWQYGNGERILALVKETVTNDLGEYRLFWLPPGSYFISAKTSPPIPLRNTSSNFDKIVAGNQIALPDEQPVFPFFFPGTTELAAAQSITVRPAGNLGGMDIVVSPLQSRTIRGVVMNRPAQNNGSIGIGVRLQTKFLTGFGSADTGLSAKVDPTTGMFEIPHVIRGSYVLVADGNDEAFKRHWHGSVPIEVGDKDIENAALSLSESVDIPIRVSIDGRLASEDEMKSLWFVMQGTSVSTPSISGGPAKPFSPGAMFLGQVPPGDYRLEKWQGFRIDAAENNGLYLKSVRLAGADTTQELHLDKPPNDPIEVELSTHGGSITGIVTDQKGEPEVNVTVLIAPDISLRKNWELFRTVRTDSAGKFLIKGLAPGNHTVFAWENLESGEWLDPKFMSANESLGKLVHIEEDETLNLQLRTVTPINR